MLARNHAAERNHLGHDLVDAVIGALKHRSIVRQNRYVNMHVAVPCVHVRGQHDAAIAHFVVCGVERRKHLWIAAHQPFQIMTKLLQHGQ